MGEKDYIDIADLGISEPSLSQNRYVGTLQEIEKQVIFETIEETGSNMAATAKKLGISRATLYRKTKEYGV